MLIDESSMNKIHNVQIDMWKVLSEVLDKLGIKYFFVHGSLLGAITIQDFIKEDDDIDIAIFRKDYEKLIAEGNNYLPEHYFIQSSLNDDFPLAFSKFRDSRTAFLQPVMAKYNCNKGIYIDIFPIDYYPENELEAKRFFFRERMLSSRAGIRLNQKSSIKTLIMKIVSLIYCPSYKKAVVRREALYKDLKHSRWIMLTNGKAKERRIPAEWFSDAVSCVFCGQHVYGPLHYKEYLSTIYGKDYIHHNPAGNRISKNNYVEISADILDFESSYKTYDRQGQ